MKNLTNVAKHHRFLLKRLSLFAVIIVVYFILVVAFLGQKAFIKNTKLSYLKDIYLPSFKYTFDKQGVALKGNLAAAFGALDSKSVTNPAASSTQVVQRTIPILLYHGVILGDDGTNLGVQRFVDQISALKKAGYNAISYDTFVKMMNGEIPVTGNPILLTFDDGRKDSYYAADPLLKTYGYNATLFVLPKYSLTSDKDSSYYLDKRELQDIAQNPRWTIESHSFDAHTYYPVDASNTPSYYYGNKLWLASANRLESDEEFAARVLNDLKKSKEIIESDLGVKVSAIALPFSEYGQDTYNYPDAVNVVPHLISEVYDHAFYQVNPANGSSLQEVGGNQLLLKRIEPRPEWTGDDLVSILRGASDKQIPFKDDFSVYNGWTKLWGEYLMSSGALTLSTDKYNKESFVTLDGTEFLKNYFYTVNLQWSKGATVSLVGRYQDAKNYTACNFSADKTTINNDTNNVLTKTVSVDNPVEFASEPTVTLGVAVNGSQIDCYIGNTVVATSSTSIEQGGIGLKFRNDQLQVSSVKVNLVAMDSINNISELKKVLPAYPSVSKDATSITNSSAVDSNQVSTKKPTVPLPYSLDLAHPDLDAAPNKLSMDNGMLTLKTVVPNTTGYAMFHQGLDWKDYIFAASVKQGVSSEFIAIARYADSKNYMACEYTDQGESVALIQVQNGKRYYRGSGQNPLSDSQKGATDSQTIGVRVLGTDVACLGNSGATVVSVDVPTVSPTGTIGFKVYARMPGFATLSILAANVSPL